MTNKFNDVKETIDLQTKKTWGSAYDSFKSKFGESLAKNTVYYMKNDDPIYKIIERIKQYVK